MPSLKPRGRLKTPYPTVRAVIVDKRDDGEGSELGEYATIAEARAAIEAYRQQGSMIACDGPADMIEAWFIESLDDDSDVLCHGV